MARLSTYIFVVGISVLLAGCSKSSTPPPKVANTAYSKNELGMSFEDAKALVDGQGDERSYDNLPVSPKPLEIYSKLPLNAEWRVWAAAGKPTLILGVFGGKVVFKQVVWNKGGELKSDMSALPEFQ